MDVDDFNDSYVSSQAKKITNLVSIFILLFFFYVIWFKCINQKYWDAPSEYQFCLPPMNRIKWIDSLTSAVLLKFNTSIVLLAFFSLCLRMRKM